MSATEASHKVSAYRHTGILFVLCTLFLFAAGIVADILQVRYRLNVPGVVYISMVAGTLLLQLSLPRRRSLSARLAIGFGLEILSVAFAAILIVTLGIPFHFSIGGRL